MQGLVSAGFGFTGTRHIRSCEQHNVRPQPLTGGSIKAREERLDGSGHGPGCQDLDSVPAFTAHEDARASGAFLTPQRPADGRKQLSNP
ncbi:MAG: hypothetical protein JWQ72_1266 [Polaromonas sp.]|nr:hypothetical protein [Polaromonas sp.]